MSLETDIRDRLVAASIGTFEATSGWGIFIGKMPKAPDTVVVISRSGGRPSDPKYLLDYPSFQILVRGSVGNYSEGVQKALDVKNELLGADSVTLPSGDRWVSITMISDIAPLGYDENERPMFSVNFQMIVESAPPSNTNRVAL